MTSRDLINKAVGSFGYRLAKRPKTRIGGQDIHEDIDIILGRKSGYLIFDLGGNEGQSVRHFLNDFREPSVVSFEPGGRNVAVMKEHYGSHPRVKIVHAAVGEAEGEGELNIYEKSQMNSLLPLEAGLQSVGAELEVVEKERVKIHSLDAFVAANNYSRIDILKMDCQGAEMSILRGAAGLLAAGRIKCLYLEVMFQRLYQSQAGLEDYRRFLEPHGFDLTGFYRPAFRQTALFHSDVLFTRRDVKSA
jgi:FkbM family methyltransferase